MSLLLSDDDDFKNCDLVGPMGITVQIILIILIFTAVKSRPLH